MKRATKKVWYVYKKIFTDPMLDHKAPTQEWVQNCVDRAEASKRAKELTRSTKNQHSYTYRTEYPDTFYNVVFITVKRAALQWIDANKPQAWFRAMFV